MYILSEQGTSRHGTEGPCHIPRARAFHGILGGNCDSDARQSPHNRQKIVPARAAASAPLDRESRPLSFWLETDLLKMINSFDPPFTQMQKIQIPEVGIWNGYVYKKVCREGMCTRRCVENGYVYEKVCRERICTRRCVDPRRKELHG